MLTHGDLVLVTYFMALKSYIGVQKENNTGIVEKYLLCSYWAFQGANKSDYTRTQWINEKVAYKS